MQLKMGCHWLSTERTPADRAGISGIASDAMGSLGRLRCVASSVGEKLQRMTPPRHPIHLVTLCDYQRTVDLKYEI